MLGLKMIEIFLFLYTYFDLGWNYLNHFHYWMIIWRFENDHDMDSFKSEFRQKDIFINKYPFIDGETLKILTRMIEMLAP